MKDEIKEILEALKPQDEEFTKAGIKEYPLSLSIREQKLLSDYITNLEQENEKKNKIIEKTRKMLHKRLLDDYDTYTANVVCDFQSDFEEIVRLNGGDE